MNSARRTCRWQRFFGSESEVNHQRMEKLLGLAAAAHPAGAAGIARRHRRGSFAATDAGRRRRTAELQVLSSAPVMTPTACRTWSRSQPAPSKNGSLEKKKHGAGAGHRSQFQRHAGESVRDLQGHGGDGRDSNGAARRNVDAPVIVCVHYACPHIEYLDRGKSRIGLE